jgi:hypothetical protein
MIKRYVFMLAVLILSACSNKPTDIRFGANPPEDMRINDTVLKKLPPTDFVLLTSYVTYTELNKEKGKPNPITGKTVSEALEDAKSWQKDQSAAAAAAREKEAQEARQAAQQEAQRKFRRDKVAGIVAVSFVKHSILPASPEAQRKEPVLQLEYDIQNKGGKAIVALKGRGVFKDLSGKTILDYAFLSDKTVPVGGHVPLEVGFSILPGSRELTSLSQTENGKFSFSFEPEVLILEGGETLKLSESQPPPDATSTVSTDK